MEKKPSKTAKLRAKPLAQPAEPAQEPRKLMTLREYCEHAGTSHNALMQFIRDKVIKYADPVANLLDPAECDALITAAQVRAGKLRGPKDDAGGDLIAMSARLTKAKTEREEAEAEIKRAKAKQLRGELIAVADLEQPLYGLARVLRERLLAMADRLGPVVAAEPRAVRCSLAIEREVKAAIAEFTASIPTMIAQVSKGSAEATDE